MREITSDFGVLHVGSLEENFKEIVAILQKSQVGKNKSTTVGLSGGSTPKAFYEWAIRTRAIPPTVWRRCLWMTSDERHVPVTSDESNFGNADRLFLSPLGVPGMAKKPWLTNLPPAECAAAFNRLWNSQFGESNGFDVCFLGMGDDGHTASLFPGCHLIGSGSTDNFAAVEWPGRGWRMTITEAGLSKCSHIVVLTNGANKADILKRVLHGPFDPTKLPVQALQACAQHVTWLVDEAAAAQL